MSTTIDAEAQRLMKHAGVQGLAFAVIDNGEIARVAAYGKRNVERNLPLTTDTIMYGASLTKPAFAYMVLQLVDEGQLNLDAIRHHHHAIAARLEANHHVAGPVVMTTFEESRSAAVTEH